MNRATRRSNRREGLTTEGTILRRIHGVCADCTAWGDLIGYGDHVTVLQVCHDESCPAYRAFQARHIEWRTR